MSLLHGDVTNAWWCHYCIVMSLLHGDVIAAWWYHDESAEVIRRLSVYLCVLHIEFWCLSMLSQHSLLKFHPPLGSGHVSWQHLPQLILQEARPVHHHIVVTIGNLRERVGRRRENAGQLIDQATVQSFHKQPNSQTFILWRGYVSGSMHVSAIE